MPPPTRETLEKELSEFCVEFTTTLFAWNELEETGRSIIHALDKGGFGLTIAVLSLNNIALIHAIRALVELQGMDKGKLSQYGADHVIHFTKGFDILRQYRNFYVHALRGFERPVDGPFRGIFSQVDARNGRLASISERVSTQELRAFGDATTECLKYGDMIYRNLGTPNALEAFGDRPAAIPLAELDKPAWPSPPKKERQFWFDTFS